jgi:hypothetical protein
LSQFDGDVLPPLDGRRIRQRTENGTLRRGDLLHWVETLQSGDTKLATHFLDHQNGEFFVSLWRVPSSKLPSGAVPGDDFIVTRSGIQPIRLSSNRLARLRILRQMARQEKKLKPKTTREFNRRLRKFLQLFAERTAFTRNFKD